MIDQIILECSVCGKPILENPIACSECKAFWFCSETHFTAHSRSQCKNAQRFIKLRPPNILLPFEWYPRIRPHPSECTVLNQLGIHLKGPWRRECHCLDGSTLFGSEENAHLLKSLLWPDDEQPSSVTLSKHDILNTINDDWWGTADLKQLLSRNIPPTTKPPSDWPSYCSQHDIPTSSPLPLLLHSVLTVYRAIERLRVLKKGKDGDALASVCVCLVGVEKELDQWVMFLELTCLLPSTYIHLLFIGPEVPEWLHDQRLLLQDDGVGENRNNGMVFQFKRGFFDDVYGCIHDGSSTPTSIDIPDIIIGLHAGLGAYQTWSTRFQSPRKLLERYDAPQVMLFTDYIAQSADISRNILLHTLGCVPGVSVSDVQINPFRKPVWVHQSTHLMHYAPNGFEVWLERCTPSS